MIHNRRSPGLTAAVAGLGAMLIVSQALLSAPEPSPTPERRQRADRPATWGNPHLSFLPAGARPDPRYWQQVMERRATERRAAPGHPAAGGSFAESEPNDTQATADAVPGFGSGEGQQAAIDVSGTFSVPSAPVAIGPFAEDDGSIPLASATGLVPGAAVVISATIGDGPFGNAGTGSGDFDFYAITGVSLGQQIVVDIDTPLAMDDLDTFIAIYDSAGNIIALNEDDDSGGTFDSFLAVPAPADGDYFVSVAGSLFPFAALLGDPFDSSSGPGFGPSEGDYTVTLSLDRGDRDWFSFELETCDILGVSLVGAGSHLQLVDASGQVLIASSQDLSGAYPPASPLPGGGEVALHHVAAAPGSYALRALGTEGTNYTLELRVFRQPQESSPTEKILFVDFDGATIDTSIFIGAPQGTANLSPLADFLGNWGLGPGDEAAVIDAILAALGENLDSDPFAGPNSLFGVEIRNSRDHPDPFGRAGVSRLIVGGTIPELGFATIGIAQSIDPGNFELAETGVILLDLLSQAPPAVDSLNSFPLAAGASMIDFIGIAIGNIAAHEAGHYTGNFHTEQLNANADLMDRGGNLPNTLGVGADGIFGNEDDEDVDFGADNFVDSERFAGVEETLAVMSCGCSVEGLFADGFESGNTTNWSHAQP